jgi:hypothetical protein
MANPNKSEVAPSPPNVAPPEGATPHQNATPPANATAPGAAPGARLGAADVRASEDAAARMTARTGMRNPDLLGAPTGPREIPLQDGDPEPIRPRHVMGGLSFVNDHVAPGSTPLTPDHVNPIATPEQKKLGELHAKADAHMADVRRDVRDQEKRIRQETEENQRREAEAARARVSAPAPAPVPPASSSSTR